MNKRSVAVIGSFKQHNESVQVVCAALRSAGITVTSPRGSEVLKQGVDFVRFGNDRSDWPDPSIQSLALHRIFAADMVYVVAPGGYVGRTTCYEIGRVIQRRQPIYFSEQPLDLPLSVPASFVLDQTRLFEAFDDHSWQPRWLFSEGNQHDSVLERELIEGTLRDE